MDKPLPDYELVTEASEECDCCLLIYAASDRARAFVQKECKTFGMLFVKYGGEETSLPPPQSILAQLMGMGTPEDKKDEPPPPDPNRVTVYKLTCFHNYKRDRVEQWLDDWPHVSQEWEAAIEEIEEP